MVAQRKMFQACASAVQLGCSATNCYSYTVFLWQKRLVLASNKWHTSVAMLAKEESHEGIPELFGRSTSR